MSFGNPQIVSTSGSSVQPTGTGPAPAQGPSSGIITTVAATPAAGVALINGVQTFLSWTTPNDGKAHTAIVAGTLNIPTSEVGGAISVNWTAGGQGRLFTLFAASLGASNNTASWIVEADPGTAVTVTQTALTGGAATFIGTITGA